MKNAANAVLAGAGYNFSLLLRWLGDILRQILKALFVLSPAQSDYASA